MNQPLLALIAVLCNVAAQLSIKEAGRNILFGGGLLAWLNPLLFLAMSLYGLSFLLTVRVFASNPLTIAAPIMAGGTFVLIAVTGAWLLGESLGTARILGMGLILAGIVLLTRTA
jgi:multidrug transporter EmrE-like cation transporter